MNKIIDYIVLFLCVSLMHSACKNQTNWKYLVSIDSLIMQDPDSACELLAAYSADSLPTADDRAYHALLTTIADYKAYHPATTDSIINIAVNHYDHNGANQDHRMRSLLYKGCVMEELGYPKEAMRCYKEAQYECPDNDNFHKGYIHFRIASLYHGNHEYKQAIKNFKKSSLLFDCAGNGYYLGESYKYLGMIYRLENADSAFYYINKGIELSKLNEDKTGYYKGLANLAGYYFYNKKEYSKAISYANAVIRGEGKDFIYDYDVYAFACQSYLELGNTDSAQQVLSMIPKIETSIDSLHYYRCQAEIFKKKKVYNSEFNKCIEIAEKLEDSMLTSPLNNGLVEVEKDVEDRFQRSHMKLCWSGTGILFLIVLLVVLKYYLSKKNREKQVKLFEEEINKLNEEISSLIIRAELFDKTNRESSQTQEELIDSLDNSLTCYSIIMSKFIMKSKLNGEDKNNNVKKHMNEEFFDKLHKFVNIRYNNILDKIEIQQVSLSTEDVNIICLELCKFPTGIIWIYSSYEREHSVFKRKRKIAAKFGCKSISEIPEKFK